MNYFIYFFLSNYTLGSIYIRDHVKINMMDNNADEICHFFHSYALYFII